MQPLALQLHLTNSVADLGGYSGVAKGGPGRAQALPNASCALLPRLQKDQDTLIEQSNILLKQSVN